MRPAAAPCPRPQAGHILAARRAPGAPAGGGAPDRAAAVRGLGGVLALAVVASLGLARPAAGVPPESLAVFEAWERIGRDWPATLVTYSLSLPAGRAWPGRVRLLDAADRPQPVQLWRVRRHPDGSLASARVSFRAALPRGGHYRYRLVSGRPAGAESAPSARRRSGYLVLGNDVTALRLRAPGTRIFAPALRPVSDPGQARRRAGRMEGAGLAFGPVAGIRLADGRWVGDSYFAAGPDGAAPRVTGYSSRVVEQGPLFVEARIEFRFEGGGAYRLTARLLAHDPVIRLDEQVDLGATSLPAGPIDLVLSLGGGARDRWRPDAAFLLAPNRRDRAPALEAALARHGLTPRGASVTIPAPAGAQVVAELTSQEPWGPWADYVGLVETGALAARRDAPMVAVVPLHAGTWRAAHAVDRPRPRIVALPGGAVALRSSLRAEPHPQNLLHTGEFDPEVGLTGVRRLWGLVAGSFEYHDQLTALRESEGFIGLDDYKDWILEWSDDTRAARERPPSDAELREPGPWWQLHRVWADPGEPGRPWATHYRQAEASDWIPAVAARLADPRLPAVERGRLRSAIAALCHLLAEPDFNTRASMAHQGNPNMPINRFFALPFAARLIPDHPMHERWMAVSAEYLRYLLARNVAPGGAWSESTTYFAAGAPTLIHGALVVRDSGRLDPAARALATDLAAATLRLLTPRDPRFGVRVLPGFGHEGTVVFNHWLPAAALVADRDPELASVLAWAWTQQGRPMGGQHDDGFSALTRSLGDLAARARPGAIRGALGSAWLPGFGAVLRAHAGTPGETYLAYRQGYLISHSDANQGDFVLYAEGAPLVAGSVLAYPLHQQPGFIRLDREFGWHSRPRFGDPGDDGGWPGGGALSGVHGHFWSESVDYVRGAGDWTLAAGGGPTGTHRWTRQLMLVKSRRPDAPSYVVIHDSVHDPDAGGAAAPGAPRLRPWWWYLRTPGTAEQVAPFAGGFVYTSPWGPRLDVHLLGATDLRLVSRDAVGHGELGGHVARAWRDAGSPTVAWDGNTARVDDAITVTRAGPIAPGASMTAVLYPRQADTVPPRIERLGEGAVRVTTARGTDYVFMSRGGKRFRADGVEFEGTAGAVRVDEAGTELLVAEGAGVVVWGGSTLRVDAPARRLMARAAGPVDDAVEVPPPPPTIAFALDPGAGPITPMGPGMWRQRRPDGIAYEFRAAEPLDVAEGGLLFRGTRGGLVVDSIAGTVSAVLLEGDRIGFGGLRVEGTSGPLAVTFHSDRVTGRSDGPARLIRLTVPRGLDRMPALILDGVPRAPGLLGRLAVVAVGPGPCTFRLEALPQPPVFRSLRVWDDALWSRPHADEAARPR